MLAIEIFKTHVNASFIQHLKSSINRDHSDDSDIKGHGIAHHFKIITTLPFYQETTSSFFENNYGDSFTKDT